MEKNQHTADLSKHDLNCICLHLVSFFILRQPCCEGDSIVSQDEEEPRFDEKEMILKDRLSPSVSPSKLLADGSIH